MTYVEKIQEWNRDQVDNHGLVDIKFFVGNGFDPLPPEITVEDLAREAYLILTGPSEDVTDELL